MNEDYKICLVSDDLCHIRMVKCGSGTMKGSFHMIPEVYTKEKHGHLKKSIILRDPLTRIVSAFYQILKQGWNAIPGKTKKIEKFFKTKSFEDFLEEIENNGFFNAHLAPQYLYLEAKNLTLDDIDYIIDFANFDEVQKINPNVLIKHFNKNRNKCKEIDKTIEIALKNKDRIYKLYEKDFLLYENVKSSKT